MSKLANSRLFHTHAHSESPTPWDEQFAQEIASGGRYARLWLDRRATQPLWWQLTQARWGYPEVDRHDAFVTVAISNGASAYSIMASCLPLPGLSSHCPTEMPYPGPRDQKAQGRTAPRLLVSCGVIQGTSDACVETLQGVLTWQFLPPVVTSRCKSGSTTMQ
ncbi:hypothetical protein KV580_00860 [Pseudomonas chlororaphis]|nr:hypothetical protein [Pseudomonas chlororaphis]